MRITREKALRLREIIEMAMTSAPIDDAIAIEGTSLFPAWKVDTEYKVGDRVRFEDVLYSVVQAHTSLETWTPDVTYSLYAKVLIPDENEIPTWEQPDSTNAYKKDDKVSYNDKIWISLVDNNVWEPGAVGTETLWAEVAAE